MVETAVINSSPLIFLSRGGHLDLLQLFAHRIVVPDAVAVELRHKGPNDISVIALETTPWIEVVPAIRVHDRIIEWGLGPGESSVLAFALATPGVDAIIDDLAARQCAASLNIPVRGTLGIVLAAKQRNLVPSARAVMDDLIKGGMYLSSTVLESALSRVGE